MAFTKHGSDSRGHVSAPSWRAPKRDCRDSSRKEKSSLRLKTYWMLRECNHKTHLCRKLAFSSSAWDTISWLFKDIKLDLPWIQTAASIYNFVISPTFPWRRFSVGLQAFNQTTQISFFKFPSEARLTQKRKWQFSWEVSHSPGSMRAFYHIYICCGEGPH